jgi:exonuclease SbcD
MLDDAHRPRPGAGDGDRLSRIGRSPLELFGDYLGEQNIEDPRISAMFAELLDEITGASGETTGMTSVSPGEA